MRTMNSPTENHFTRSLVLSFAAMGTSSIPEELVRQRYNAWGSKNKKYREPSPEEIHMLGTDKGVGTGVRIVGSSS